MSLLDDVIAQAAQVHLVAGRYRISNPRIFGSVAHRQDHTGSDIDLLIDTDLGCSLLDVVRFAAELEGIFGRPVDVRTINEFHPSMKPSVLAEAIALLE